MNIFNSNQELFQKTSRKLCEDPEYKCNPRNLFIHEDLGFSARIINPRDRLIMIPERKWDIVYGLGEFLWYVTGSDSLEFISYYAPSYEKFSDNGKNLYGAYGKRLFMSPQMHAYSSSTDHNESGVRSVIRKLRQDPDSRQALCVVWREDDMHVLKTKDLPCTVALQFFIRENKLCMITNMRSNDVWLGSTNDIFCFTMIHELVASELGIEMGWYQHDAGSMHMYENTIEKMKGIPESFYKRESLPMSRINNFYEQIRCLIRYEKEIRNSSNEFSFMKLFTKKIKISLSQEMLDLFHVLFYGKIRKLYKKDAPKRFEILLEETLSAIKQDSIRRCIEIYEGLRTEI